MNNSKNEYESSPLTKKNTNKSFLETINEKESVKSKI
jgi:hypothetical protein